MEPFGMKKLALFVVAIFLVQASRAKPQSAYLAGYPYPYAEDYQGQLRQPPGTVNRRQDQFDDSQQFNGAGQGEQPQGVRGQPRPQNQAHSNASPPETAQPNIPTSDFRRRQQQQQQPPEQQNFQQTEQEQQNIQEQQTIQQLKLRQQQQHQQQQEQLNFHQPQQDQQNLQDPQTIQQLELQQLQQKRQQGKQPQVDQHNFSHTQNVQQPQQDQQNPQDEQIPQNVQQDQQSFQRLPQSPLSAPGEDVAHGTQAFVPESVIPGDEGRFPGHGSPFSGHGAQFSGVETQFPSHGSRNKPTINPFGASAGRTTTQPPTERPRENPKPVKATIESFHVDSKIQLRYARTEVTMYMKNPSKEAGEVVFTMVIPSTAFISNFSMSLEGKEYVATVEEKETAKEKYKAAASLGRAAGLVQQDSRNANQVSVSVNVEGEGKVKFRLVYEEFLQRQLDRYEHVVHVNLNQVVEDFKISVHIDESLPIMNLQVPAFKVDPNAIIDPNFLNKEATVSNNPRNVADIVYKPSVESQKLYIKKLWTREERLSGQLIVRYDVDRSAQDGNEIQVLDGYFVHFFAPEKLDSMPKHLVLVLDVSGSMEGEKLAQMKDAMVTIFDDLTDVDTFNIVVFSDEVTHWRPDGDNTSVTFKGTKEMKEAAMKYVLGLEADGGTNINEAVLEGIRASEKVKNTAGALPPNARQSIIFQTDGEPTVGEILPSLIRKNIVKINSGPVPIYGLAFGRDADYELIRRISIQSGGFARRIFEGSDAAIQLEDFYQQLANPLLTNVKFNYVGLNETDDVLTTTDFKTVFKGGEAIVMGRVPPSAGQKLRVSVQGLGKNGPFVKTICYGEQASNCTVLHNRPPLPQTEAENFLERLWAFLTVKNSLDDGLDGRETIKEETVLRANIAKRRAKGLELALKYNFVTDVTSLVVTRPEDDLNAAADDVKKAAVEIVSLDKDGSSFADTSPNFSANNDEDKYSFDYDEVLEIRGSSGKGENLPKTVGSSGNKFANGECKIKLFSKTYLRGEVKELDADAADLSDFDKMTTSVEVRGTCCWTLYTEPNFVGGEKKFSAGQYKSSGDLEHVFRNVSSVRRSDKC